MDNQQPSTSRGNGSDQENGKASNYHGQKGRNQATGDQRGAAGGQASGRQGSEGSGRGEASGNNRTGNDACAGPSRRQYAGQYGGRVVGLRGGARDGEGDADLNADVYEPPAVPILDKIKILKGIKPVTGFEGSFVNIAFLSNVSFSMKQFILIEWFVGRATFKGNDRQDQELICGTKHSIRALLDQSMEGPILAHVYSVAYDRLILEYKLWSRCRIIPTQTYGEQRVRPSGYYRSLSAITRRSRFRHSKRSVSARRRSPSPLNKKKQEEQTTPQEYARAILMPPGSFGLYDNCPKDLNWQPRSVVDIMTCNHKKYNYEKIFKRCSPRRKQSEPSAAAGTGSELPQMPKSRVKGNNGGSPMRQLPHTPTRQQKLSAQRHMNGPVSPQRRRPVLPPTERLSRSPRRAELPEKPHSASPQHGPIMHTLTVPHRRYRSLSPVRLPTSTVGTQTMEGRKPFCDCWRRANCDQCIAADEMLFKMLCHYNSWYCHCTRMWYKISHEYNKISEGIRKMNQENR